MTVPRCRPPVLDNHNPVHQRRQIGGPAGVHIPGILQDLNGRAPMDARANELRIRLEFLVWFIIVGIGMRRGFGRGTPTTWICS